MTARFHPTADFARWRPVFDEELRLIDMIDERMTEWEAAYRPIDEHLTLFDPTGEPVTGLLLHIQGDEAWWREG